MSLASRVTVPELFLFDAQACPLLLSIGATSPSSGAREYFVYLPARCSQPLTLLLCHRLATPCTSLLRGALGPRYLRSCGQGGQRLMLPLASSSFFASALHILRGDSISDTTSSCRDIDTYLLCMHSCISRVLLERLILFSSTPTRGTQHSRRTYPPVFAHNPSRSA